MKRLMLVLVVVAGCNTDPRESPLRAGSEAITSPDDQMVKFLSEKMKGFDPDFSAIYAYPVVVAPEDVQHVIGSNLGSGTKVRVIEDNAVPPSNHKSFVMPFPTRWVTVRVLEGEHKDKALKTIRSQLRPIP